MVCSNVNMAACPISRQIISGSVQNSFSGARPAAHAHTVPVTIPEKFAQVKMLVELEPREGGVTDLTGDAGAVGRPAPCPFPGPHGAAGDESMQIDLKGEL